MFLICSQVPDLPTAYPLRDLWDAAIRHRTVRLTCAKCGHVSMLSASSLWYLFHRNGWKEWFADVRRRCVCIACLERRGVKIRNPSLELVDDSPTDFPLPEPPEPEWKKEMRRRR